MQPTLEAIEELAARARSGAVVLSHQRDALRARYEHARAASAALGTLVAEAHTQIQHERAREALDRAWAAEPATITAGPEHAPRAIAIASLESVVTLEREDARRRAIWSAATARAGDHFAEARAAVDSLRDCAASLSITPTDALLDRLGLGHAPAASAVDAVLATTDGPFEELDAWALRECGLTERVVDARRRSLAFDDRLRSLSQPRASAQIALGDRGASCARWIARVGLGDAMAKIVDRVESSSPDATRIRVRIDREGVRVVLVGDEDATVLGGARLAAAWAEALALVLPNEPSIAARAGVDRIHRTAAHALGKALFFERPFVTRELGVDPAQSAVVARAGLHGALFELRRSCAEVAFARAVLGAQPELATRLRDAHVRAVFSAPDPIWASHVAAATLERRAEANVLGALVEATLHARLRDGFDEDWFRNPRAGEALASELAKLRAAGAIAWLREASRAENDSDAIAHASVAVRRRVSEAFERATR
ncbi:MAG: hypothetical protein JNK05_33435 [Myxococcales bacterium]|nr:hypothetical protein [Myxococcales bacterium]